MFDKACILELALPQPCEQCVIAIIEPARPLAFANMRNRHYRTALPVRWFANNALSPLSNLSRPLIREQCVIAIFEPLPVRWFANNALSPLSNPIRPLVRNNA